MAQTPYRDIIKTATVDFRFYNGTVRNYANNTNVLAFDYQPIFQKVNGVDALVYSADGVASQTWMTDVSGTQEVTIEILVSPDMFHLDGGSSDAEWTTNIINGDWNIGFVCKPGTGQSFTTRLWASFNGVDYTQTAYVMSQDLDPAESYTTVFKGSPLHVVLSAKYLTDTSLAITTYVNGVYDTETDTDYTNNYMDPTPTNSLFDGATSGYANLSTCPVHMLRMYESYITDTLILADMFKNAKKILPNAKFAVPKSGAITFYSPA